VLKLREVREAYEVLTAKSGDVARQMNLAAIGIVWLFRAGTLERPVIAQPLLSVLVLAVTGLALDFLQYLVGSAVWFSFFRDQERDGKRLDDDVSPPDSINDPMWWLFFLKCLTTISAYGIIVWHFAHAMLG
jgi:hypothetical protein